MAIAPQFTPAEAAEVARRHVVTIRIALERGELHGTQRVPGGRWVIDERCLESYMRAQKCEHQDARRGNVTALRRAG